MPIDAHATLHAPFDPVRDHVLAAPLFQDCGAILSDGMVELTFGVGQVRLSPGGKHHTALLVRAADTAGLQVLRDFVTDTARQSGLDPEWHERHRRGRPANLCLARVVSVETLSPAFRRITIEGPDLAALLGGGLHFRLLLGPGGSDWPQIDEAGVTQWPGGAAVWHRPVYTVRDIDGAGAVTRVGFDIFLHVGGRVSAWSETLRVGDQIGLTGPSGGDVPAKTGWIGVFGDETALPAVARILAALPGDTVGQAVISVPSAADIQALSRPAGVALRWCLRGDAEDLLDALADLRPPATDRFVFFAASRTQASRARHILGGMGLTRQEFWAQAYWQDGDAPAEE
ncbi:MAG TPA: siderophore-interacting protein [Paenirhodobacter sp.]